MEACGPNMHAQLQHIKFSDFIAITHVRCSTTPVFKVLQSGAFLGVLEWNVSHISELFGEKGEQRYELERQRRENWKKTLEDRLFLRMNEIRPPV